MVKVKKKYYFWYFVIDGIKVLIEIVSEKCLFTYKPQNPACGGVT